jgi:hypothetical protein
MRFVFHFEALPRRRRDWRHDRRERHCGARRPPRASRDRSPQPPHHRPCRRRFRMPETASPPQTRRQPSRRPYRGDRGLCARQSRGAALRHIRGRRVGRHRDRVRPHCGSDRRGGYRGDDHPRHQADQHVHGGIEPAQVKSVHNGPDLLEPARSTTPGGLHRSTSWRATIRRNCDRVCAHRHPRLGRGSQRHDRPRRQARHRFHQRGEPIQITEPPISSEPSQIRHPSRAQRSRSPRSPLAQACSRARPVACGADLATGRHPISQLQSQLPREGKRRPCAGERPVKHSCVHRRRCAAERDKLAPPHWTISSALRPACGARLVRLALGTWRTSAAHRVIAGTGRCAL